MTSEPGIVDSGPAAGLPTKAFVQRAGGAPGISFGPQSVTRFMFSGVAGHPDFYEYSAARGDSAPLHRHPWATFELILEGSVRFLVDGEEFVAGAGDFVYTPPSAVHTFVIESDTSRFVGFNHPAPRFAELQERAAPIFASEDGPDMAKLTSLTQELGVELLGPPLEPRA